MNLRNLLVFLTSLAVAATALALLWIGTAPSTAAAGQQPYGGCDEAWQAPHSAGADDCRALGWTVRPGVVLNPHGVLRYWNLGACTYEDGSGSGRTCGWLGQRDGNKRGMSFYVTGPEDARRGHYFWAPSPLLGHAQRQWVTGPEADALAEGSAPHATTRNWERCWTTPTSEQAVCADGYVEKW